jgi:hypothetical protein
MIPRARHAIPALLVLAALAGCDYFSPTEPEPPDPGTPLIGDFSHPDSTLATWARAIEAKGGSGATSVYREAFADSTVPTTPAYHQFFWPEDVREYENTTGLDAPADWGIQDEITFYGYFVGYRPGEYHVELVPDPPNPDDLTDPDVAELHRHYTVTAGSVTIARGFADLVLIRGSDARWRITVWEDRRDPLANPSTEERSLGWRRLNSLGGGT